jgi:hypothetical protein
MPSPLTEPDHSPRGAGDDSAGAASTRASTPGRSRTARPPLRHIRNRLAGIGRQAGGGGRGSACTGGGHRARLEPRAKGRHAPRELPSKLAPGSVRASPSSVHHHVHGRRDELVVEQPIQLTQTPATARAHHRRADLARGCQSKATRPRARAPKTEEHQPATRDTLAVPIDPLKLRAPTQATFAPQATRQTARRLRPLRRRALSTLRPPFERIRTLKPWVRLRCRLFG